VIEHGMGGARAAAPVAKDVLTWLFDRQQAIDRLAALEAGWGGDIRTRMAAKEATYRTAQGLPGLAPVPSPSPSASPSATPRPTPAPRASATPAPRPSPAAPAPTPSPEAPTE
jgi:penicillin-binding protein 2